MGEGGIFPKALAVERATIDTVPQAQTVSHISHITYHISYIIYHISHITYHISHIICLTYHSSISILQVPAGWGGPGPQDGVPGPLLTFSTDSAFMMFNLVANYAYSRWTDIYPDLYNIIIEKEKLYDNLLVKSDMQALGLYNKGQVEEAIQEVTQFGLLIGEKLLKEWFQVFGDLFVKYR